MTASTSSITTKLSSHDDNPRAASLDSHATEQDPLLGASSYAQLSEQTKKPWYRARPLWIVPFAVTASLCRNMTIAPRTEVFIQLACEELSLNRHHTSRHHHTLSDTSILVNVSVSRSSTPYHTLSGLAPSNLENVTFVQASPIDDSPLPEDSTEVKNQSVAEEPPINCLADSRVQSGAARLQTILTTTMGLLSALTTGWWGQFGDRHGRTKAIAAAVSGSLFTDIMFIVASDPPEILKGQAHHLLVAAPVLEGLLGGWSTLQGATHAYISDCTSHGSRAQIFSRFTGVFYIGFALGPEIAAIILRSTHQSVLVFYASAICALVNLFLLLFVFPESLSVEVRASNVKAAQEARLRALRKAEGKEKSLWRSIKVAVKTFLKPLGILGPKQRSHGRGLDWSLTLLGLAMFCSFLTVGLYPIKYLYAKHMFSWDGETLSYYITAVGSVRAIHLLLILPAVIRVLKPIPKTHSPKGKTAKSQKKPTPTPKALLGEIKFDLMVAKVSGALDMLSHVLLTIAKSSSEPLFVGYSAIASFGAGLAPALQSVAMCTLHLREHGGEFEEEEEEEGQAVPSKGGSEVGRLFGAFAIMQAVGSMILGPLLFGAVYSTTVGTYPQAAFIVCAGLLLTSVVLLLLIRPPRVDIPIEIRVDTEVQVDVERVRGRSRQSKNISFGLQGDPMV